MIAPAFPDGVLDASTRLALADGVRIMQGHRLADTDAGHVSALLGYMAPRLGATILDIGCGFGEVARLMKAERPDLDFVLLNRNALQLAHAPDSFARVQADMHEMPVATASVDGAMFCYSLCHADFPVALAEAARVTRCGGEMFVYDYVRTGGGNRLFEARLAARALPFGDMVKLAPDWAPTMFETPKGDDALFRRVYGNGDEYDMIFADLIPAVWKMVRL